MNPKAWREAGAFHEVAGLRLFVRETGDPAAAPERTLLLLHGFPESSYSFHKVFDALGGAFDRVVVHDMPGFGFSDKPVRGFGYSLIEQADVALLLWRALGVRGGHLLAHDMGDSVATELAARAVHGLLPAWFDAGLCSLTLTNGSVVLELADLRITQRLLLSPLGPWLSRLFVRRAFDAQVRSAHGAPSLSREDLDAMWAQIEQGGGRLLMHRLITYLQDRRRFERDRWLPALGRLQVPLHLCWGRADAVAREQIVDHLLAQVCPQAQVTRLPGVGHFAQLSDPEPWTRAVLAFYRGIGAHGGAPGRVRA